MKRRNSSYLSGVFTATLVLALTTTAMAASGKVTFNFSNVALHGEKKIAAGTEITVANGQQVPSSILYTDPAGGKTNYLPIRAISDLLGVEIGYNSATKTVELKTTKEDSGTVEAGSLETWKRTFEGNCVRYTLSGRREAPYPQAPAWRPSWLPEGWALSSSGVETPSNALLQAAYQNDTDQVNSRLSFHCYAPSDRTCGSALGAPGVKAVDLLREATVQGRRADFFQTEEYGNILFWSNTAGYLFKLSGDFDQATLEQVANSVQEVSKTSLPDYYMDWTPEGCYNTSRNSVPNVVRETWKDANDVSFEWMYAREPLAYPDRAPETVTVNGARAKFWPGLAEGGLDIDRGNGLVHIYTDEQKNLLLWEDPASGLTFRLVGMMEKEELIRMAESMVLK